MNSFVICDCVSEARGELRRVEIGLARGDSNMMRESIANARRLIDQIEAEMNVKPPAPIAGLDGQERNE